MCVCVCVWVHVCLYKRVYVCTYVDMSADEMLWPPWLLRPASPQQTKKTLTHWVPWVLGPMLNEVLVWGGPVGVIYSYAGAYLTQYRQADTVL